MLTVYNHSDKPATHSMGLEKWDLLIWYGIRKDNKFYRYANLVQLFKVGIAKSKTALSYSIIVLGKTLMKIMKVLSPLVTFPLV